MSIVVTRIGTVSDAGVLTLALSVGNLLLIVGKFGMRGFQVTDVSNRFSAGTYLKSRIITVILMFSLSVVYLICARKINGFALDKCEDVFYISGIYMTEAFEDVIWGNYQKEGRIDVGAKMFSLRWVVILVGFMLSMMVTGKMAQSLRLCFVLSVFVLFIMIHIGKLMDGFLSIGKIDKWEDVPELFIQTLPFFVMGFCSMYLNNAAKFAVSNMYSDEVLACFGFVSMPVFVIGLLNNFVYQPELLSLAQLWDKKDKIYFNRRVWKQMNIVFVISIVCVFGAYICGIPVLSFIYDTDLADYLKELLILQVAGGFLALTGFLSAILTIMRSQRMMLFGYVVTMFLSIIIVYPMAGSWGTMGASIGFLGCMIFLCILYFCLYLIKINDFVCTNKRG